VIILNKGEVSPDTIINVWQRSPHIRKIYYTWYENLLKSIPIKNHYKILEIGCGVGLFANYLTLLKNVEYVGIDINSKAILYAKRLRKLDFIKCNAENLPFKEKVFDIVIGIDILHHCNTKLAIKEVSRVIKKGGYCGFIEPVPGMVQKIITSLFNFHEDVKKYPSIKNLKRYLNENHFEITNNIFSDTLLYPLSGGFSRRDLIFFDFHKLRKIDSFLSKFNYLNWKTTIICKRL
jgi:ubiquinone/menaquinone biosynthesis C-methylase UbiE